MKNSYDFTVVILDDDRKLCDCLAEMIAEWGYSVKGFCEPQAALESITEDKCDILLLDVFIADVCGLDLIPRLGKELKIIVITGSATRDIAIRALQLGAFDLLEKPFSNDSLRNSMLRASIAIEEERRSKKLLDDLRMNQSELEKRVQRLESMYAALMDTIKSL